jgi:hypothetical protein
MRLSGSTHSKRANTQESGGPAQHSTTETQFLTPIKPTIATNVALHFAKLASHPQRFQYLVVAEARLLFKSGEKREEHERVHACSYRVSLELNRSQQQQQRTRAQLGLKKVSKDGRDV